MTIHQLLKLWGRSNGYDARLTIVCKLHEFDAHDVMPLARSLIHSRKSSDRLLAVWLMGELGYPRRPYYRDRVTLLSQVLRHDSVVAVRARAAESLGQLKSPLADRHLEAYATDPSVGVRRAVSRAIAAHNSPAAKRIASRMASDMDAYVRDWIAFGLGMQQGVGRPSRLKILRNLLNDPNDEVQQEAICSLIYQRDLLSLDRMQSFVRSTCSSNIIIYAIEELLRWIESNERSKKDLNKKRKRAPRDNTKRKR